MKAAEQYFPVVLLIMLYKGFLNFQSLLCCTSVLKCSGKSLPELVENDSNNFNFCDCEANPKVQPFKLNI